jgi:hypothetical protein
MHLSPHHGHRLSSAAGRALLPRTANGPSHPGGHRDAAGPLDPRGETRAAAVASAASTLRDCAHRARRGGQVAYEPHEAGTYSMAVMLHFAHGSGLADPGDGVPRIFANRHVPGSPFAVRVAAAPCAGPVACAPDRGLPVCRGGLQPAPRQGTIAGGPGRWVHRDTCAW